MFSYSFPKRFCRLHAFHIRKKIHFKVARALYFLHFCFLLKCRGSCKNADFRRPNSIFSTRTARAQIRKVQAVIWHDEL
jgi:hypothetical protein